VRVAVDETLDSARDPTENTMKTHSAAPPRGFALIATLMIIAVLAILVTAFVIAMRTERSASSNFVERERAQAIASGMLHRLIADQSSPYIVTTGSFLGPFQTDSNTQLPLETSSNTYLADPTKAANTPMLSQIFTMPASPGISSSNHLVRISGTNATNSTAKWAYNPDYWGYARQNPNPTYHTGYFNYYPLDNTQSPIAPDWVDYYDSTGKKIGQVAYTIWDEAGKIDINMAGPDGLIPPSTSNTNITLISGRLNGLAPHDLKFEYLATDPTGLLNYLNGEDALRERNNFSLRAIVPASMTNAPAQNNTGDDRSIFSVEELLNRKGDNGENLVTAENAPDMLNVTTMSRDFEVRPEWNGDRTPTVAVSYLKSYVNNPNLFTLFAGANGTGGPSLISKLDPTNPLNAVGINNALTAVGIHPTDDWRQVGRLLAILRIALPPGAPYTRGGAVGNEDESIPAEPNLWDDQDVYAIALNLLQASDPSDDEELTAYDTKAFGIQPYQDPGYRVGMRLSPYVVETALKATRTSAGFVQVTEFNKLWNPYPVDLDSDGPGTKPINYDYGDSWSGGYWPIQSGVATGLNGVVDGMFNNGDSGDSNAQTIPQTSGTNTTLTPTGDSEGTTPPFKVSGLSDLFKPNSFVLVKHSRVIALAPGHDLVMLTRPWMYNDNYFSSFNATFGSGNPQSNAYVFTGGPLTGIRNLPLPANNNGGSDVVNMGMFFVIPAASLKNFGVSNYFSFQIDDPRMGTMARYNQFPPNQNSYTTNLIMSPGVPIVTTTNTGPPENGNTPNLYSIASSGTAPNHTPTGIRPINYSAMIYSWQPLPGKQSLWATATGKLDNTGYVSNPDPSLAGALPGCNYNFLDRVDLPPAWSNNMTSLQRYHAAMATFALPGHPFSNLGELGTVFANRPWTTLSMAENLPQATGTTAKGASTTANSFTSVPNAKVALLLDYYTTIGTTTNPTDPQDNRLNYQTSALFYTSSTPVTANITKRTQNGIWLFESIAADGTPTGSLRPIRGRINLNTASEDALMRIICGQGASSKSSDPLSSYFLVPSIGNTPPSGYNTSDARVMAINPVSVTQSEAQSIADDIIKIRPLRRMSDLVLGGSDGMGLNSPHLEASGVSTFQKLQSDQRDAFDKTDTYCTSYLADAILGRLTEFGTVRAQSYTIDMVARATKTTPAGQTVTTGEVRMLAHVYLDSFSRQAFVQSVEFR